MLECEETTRAKKGECLSSYFVRRSGLRPPRLRQAFVLGFNGRPGGTESYLCPSPGGAKSSV